MRLLALIVCVTLCRYSSAEEPDFAALSLEQLGNIEVSTASRREQKLSEVPAAVFVLTSEDIRRSGVTSIADALRLVPGLAVARSNSSSWAISSRGFNDIFANKLLVMIDGRTVYTPVFSGTYWDAQDYNLSDIERIEVVKGPGGALWGANAVNGIIHIITKKAQDTKGAELTAGVGSNDGPMTSFRIGGEMTPQADYRVYARSRKIESSKLESGTDANDQWSSVQSGFRIDGESSEDTAYSLHGDIYKGSNSLEGRIPSVESPFGEASRTNSAFSGGNIVGRLKIQTDERSELTIQGYFDRVNRAAFENGFHGNTFDLDLQHRFNFDQHSLAYGVSYRLVEDRFYGQELLSEVEPRARRYRNWGAFIQDEIELVPDEFSFIVGSKYEDNGLGGGVFSPNVRALWHPSADSVVWGAVSRAIRAVSRVQHDANIDFSPFDPGLGGVPGITRLNRNSSLDSEKLVSYELGARVSLSKELALDVSSFYGTYDDLVLVKLGEAGLGEFRERPAVIQPVFYSNAGESQTFGAEVTAEWIPYTWGRIILSYSYLDMRLEADNPELFTDYNSIPGASPEHTAIFRAQLNLDDHWEFDPTIRYVSQLYDPSIDPYFALDLRVGYQVNRNLDLSIIGQNLLEDDRSEFGGSAVGVPASVVQRGVFGRITWRF